MLHRRCLSTAAQQPVKVLKGDIRKKKQIHWSEELKAQNNVNRALAHYDDFYATVFTKQWPSLRLGLLSPPKYLAIPNTYTGNVEGISRKLEEMGAYNVAAQWLKQCQLLEAERKEYDLNRDLGRLHQLDKTLEALAATKKAEEMDVLYQNAPTSKREEVQLGRARQRGRLVSDLSEVSGQFVPSTKLKGAEDWTLDSEYFESYLRTHDNPEEDNYYPKKEGEEGEEGTPEIRFLKKPIVTLEIPKLLFPFCFENGSALMFPPAARDSASNLRQYICVNGASLLPIIALDLRPGTNLLDLCAGPGTKSVLALMTMQLDALVCNDLEISRLNRVKRIIQEFAGSRDLSNVSYTKFNAIGYPAQEEFSRVLVDVPCLNDRVSCTISDNNIFKARRTKERLNLVKIQRQILLSGFKALSKNDGSTLVYSTCTLSPIENDGVVLNALKETEVAGLHVDLIGLMKMVQPFERAGIFRIMRTRCGVLVLPSTFCNFGPMYVSRMVVRPTEEVKLEEMPPAAEAAE